MLKPVKNRKFKVWQTYKDSKTLSIESDLPIHAAECYAEINCMGKDFLCHFVGNFLNDTLKFHNNELGTIYVTESKLAREV